ncbi:alpha/beta-hydrolase [Wolfiporia cocos MD-104 SS10]|uniref:Alpha/beta-hydrolase n=1 Tax=Wolfiporia cocos (strain MD-104) TaxID=742152 RepID=A0A2H3JE07_WOLCO|nr:alpha/beta-hydrolase [Wolfiporia cocos MD-104 SS10]
MQPLSIAYKYVDGTPLLLDVYPPVVQSPNADVTQSGSRIAVPAILYFHGGGLTVGNRTSWFPAWLHRRVSDAGCVFVCVDYRLLPPSTGHDILSDIKDAISFVAHKLDTILGDRMNQTNIVHPTSHSIKPIIQIDRNAIAVVGTSAGGLCAYLAAMHAMPKPKVILSMYGMGGNLLTSHYMAPKTTVFFRGRELLDPNNFHDYIFPRSCSLPLTSDSALAYHPPTSPTPGFPANPRMFLARLYLQLGTYMDYYTGCHEPSLSDALRSAAANCSAQDIIKGAPGTELPSIHLRSIIPPEHLLLFPQFGVTSNWPSTYLVHGSADTAVLADESRYMYGLLQKAGVDVSLTIVEGKEHSFDYESDAESIHGVEGGLFDTVAASLLERLRAISSAPPSD